MFCALVGAWNKIPVVVVVDDTHDILRYLTNKEIEAAFKAGKIQYDQYIAPVYNQGVFVIDTEYYFDLIKIRKPVEDLEKGCQDKKL
jgi:hypothetical protein